MNTSLAGNDFLHTVLKDVLFFRGFFSSGRIWGMNPLNVFFPSGLGLRIAGAGPAAPVPRVNTMAYCFFRQY